MKTFFFAISCFLGVIRAAFAATPEVSVDVLREVEGKVLAASNWIVPIEEPEKITRGVIDARRRIGEMGEVADYAIAEIIVSGINERASIADSEPASQARKFLSRIMAAVRNDPKLVERLLPAYESAISTMAGETAPNQLLGVGDEVVVYILKWGTPQQKEVLKAQIEMMKSSKNVNIAAFADASERLADSEKASSLQYLIPKLPFHQWCRESAPVLEWYLEEFKARHTERVPGAPDPMEEFKRKWGSEPPKMSEPVPVAVPKPEALSAPPNQSASSAYPWVVAGILAPAAGILWWVFRRKGA